MISLRLIFVGWFSISPMLSSLLWWVIRITLLKKTESFKEGSEIKGTVKNLTDYGAFVDLGGLDGLLHITDMSWGRVSHPSE